MLLVLTQRGELKINEKTSINIVEFNKHIILMLIVIGIYVFVPVIGTLLHELGHFLVAKLNGYEAQIHYSYTTTSINPISEPCLYFYYILGGPLSTWIQSLIPFVLLLLLYNKNQSREILKNNFLNKYFLLCLIFISMGGRFIFNLLNYVLFPSNTIDEYKMALYLMINPETFLIIFAGISLVLLIVALYKVPKSIRINFLVSALIGSALGYYLWYYVLGPVILP